VYDYTVVSVLCLRKFVHLSFLYDFLGFCNECVTNNVKKDNGVSIL